MDSSSPSLSQHFPAASVFPGSNIDDFVADALIVSRLCSGSDGGYSAFYQSRGGFLRATMSIFDVVQLVRADVSLGISTPTASIIFCGGTKGKRFAMPNTLIMIHQPLGGASGEAIDVEVQAREIMHNKTNVTKIISDFTGII